MKRIILSIALVSALSAACTSQKDAPAVATPVDFTHVTITDNFWKPRIDVNADVTIPHSIKKCYEEGRVDNFLFASGAKQGRFQGIWGFNDSDVYKVLEGMAFTYSVRKDADLLAQMDTLISYIGAAQQSDGYLYTPWTLRVRDYADIYCTYNSEPYDNLVQSHEFYNMGHMYEAAVAHYTATGQRNFLDIAIKSADHIYDVFGPGKREAVPGHEEIEIGLLKLYGATQDSRYLELAGLLLERRGHGILGGNPYYQDHLPVLEQREALGHSVRANYLYTAMARYAALTRDPAYIEAVDGLWDNVVGRKMYLTGGMGAIYDGESYGADYELPNVSYAETCAAIAGVFWAGNMFALHADASYIDVMERILYNGLISGISLDGTKFFYPNVLTTEDAGDFNRGNRSRAEWFDCSCCPTNDVRFISSLPGYVYAVRGREVYANLFVASDASFEVEGREVKISQSTDYPWSGKVGFTVSDGGDFDLMLRIPLWAQGQPLPGGLYSYVDGGGTCSGSASGSSDGCGSDGDASCACSSCGSGSGSGGGSGSSCGPGWTVYVCGEKVECTLERGYCRISRRWKAGDTVTLDLQMTPRIAAARDEVEADRGKLAVERGPIVYCAESVDNLGKDIYREPISKDTAFSLAEEEIAGSRVNALLTDGGLTLIPYYAWNHRGEGAMTVWLQAK